MADVFATRCVHLEDLLISHYATPKIKNFPKESRVASHHFQDTIMHFAFFVYRVIWLNDK